MVIPEGADIAIVVGVVLLLFAAAIGVFFLARKINRRRIDRQRAAASRELALDFDTSDVEFWSSTHPTLGHTRDWSTASAADLSRPLITSNNGWSRHTPADSLESDIQPISLLYSSRPHSPYSPPILPPIRIPYSPPPLKQHSGILSTEDPGLARFEYHPTFLTSPRAAPRPESLRRGRPEKRSAVLTRLISTKSSRKARSLDGRSVGESEASVYSQASATTTMYMELEGTSAHGRGDATPMPPLPIRYPSQHKTATVPREILVSPTPARPQRKLRPKAHVTARYMATSHTLDSNPFGAEDDQSKVLRDSLAYPLPVTPSSPKPPYKSPGSPLLASAFTFPSPPPKSPSPAIVYISPSRISYPATPPRPPRTTPRPSRPNGVVNLRNVRSSRVSLESDIVHSKRADSGERGIIGYQLPSHWRVGQISRAQSPLDGVAYRIAPSVSQ